MIPHNKPFISPTDIAAIAATLDSGWIAHGPQVNKLEDAFSQFMGGGSACACSSGTAALFLALSGHDLTQGKRVAVPSYTCSALLNAIHMAGATPVICDVDPTTFCLDANSIPDVDGAIAVHTYGARADVESIRHACPIVIEDCCQSLGGRHEGVPLGSAGDSAVFSFYATKIITCGHGGLVWSKREEVAAFSHDYKDFDGRDTYKPRFNVHLSDIQASMVLSQMQHLDAIIAHRSHCAAMYLDALPSWVSVQAGMLDKGRMHYRFVIMLDDRPQRDNILAALRAENIGAVIPVEDWELLHRYLYLDPSKFPVAERIADTTISLPMHMSLTENNIMHICNSIRRIF